MKHQAQWDDLVWHLKQIDHPINYLIAATPTGPIRERLTEANVHLMVAEQELMKAVEAAKNAETGTTT